MACPRSPSAKTTACARCISAPTPCNHRCASAIRPSWCWPIPAPWRAVCSCQASPRRILHVGLGGGSLPRFFHARLPESMNVAVELNPQVVALCQSMFCLPADERMQVVTGDGVDYMGQQTAAFDTILIDAFDGYNIITAMVAEPFLHDCRMALGEGGVLAVNLWSRHPRYHQHLDAMRHAFDGRVLVLPAETHGNVAAFALRDAPGHALRFDQLEARARTLQDEHGLDFPAMVAALKKANQHTASRLLP
ncbi:fused MFS/spermidine synthase [Laribacter hongkongensis]|uniref:fused MFS/spermidine synthase n=1 Tax=Laribacter hongkongensis TaxID=168471 RepID=UPI001EFDD47F|nr:fused MFS/spermidine synthase [Laribacter hongkongensis]MCG9101379.1 fused MFS/spermidine synthase [Laribacter hongkongensis]MCG9103683.1 fused MFS/spermidine synthase [Laribacter hongkongensis]MCG9113905.1 fused MFS/spermidine synthase [Laribacter hongkongensis]